jgi:plasmid stabilization system protein ParE
VPGFRLTKSAQADVEDIGAFTQHRWDDRQAVRYLTGLDACFSRLADMPVLGRPYRPLPLYQWFRYVSHVVYFRRKDDGDIIIIRVLGKKMDPELNLAPSRDDEPDEGE